VSDAVDGCARHVVLEPGSLEDGEGDGGGEVKLKNSSNILVIKINNTKLSYEIII
jgi:hypothetical protein